MKIISIALFGNSSATDGSGMAYHQYLVSFVLSHANLFPASEGWQLRLFMDHTDSPTGELALRMWRAGLLTMKTMGPPIRTRAMLWRMAPVFDSDVEYVFPRDIDHCPMPRDRAVCDQFIKSVLDVHTVHDSQSHAGIMGGLSGFHAPAFRSKTGLSSLDDLYAYARKSDAEWAEHGTDQVVLNRLVESVGKLTLLEHRYSGWQAGPGKYPARAAGTYGCKAFSTPIPAIGKSKLNPELQAEADLLANHLGAAGYDHQAAVAFWETNGDPEIARLVRDCEAP